MYFDRVLWAFTHGFRMRVLLGVVLGLASFGAACARLVLLGLLLARVIQRAAASDLAVLIVALVIAIAVRGVVQYAKDMVAYEAAGRIQRVLRNRLYEKLIELGPAHLGKTRSGAITVTVVEGVEQLQTFFGLYLPTLFVAALVPALLFAAALPFDLVTAAVFLTFGILTLLAPSLLHRWNSRGTLRRGDLYSKFAAEFIDAVQGLGTLNAFGQSEASRERLARRAHDVFRSTMWVLATNSASRSLAVLTVAAGAVAALGLTATRADRGDVALTGLLVLLVMGAEVFQPVRHLSTLGHQGLMGASAAAGVRTLLATTPMIADTAPRSRSTHPRDASIAFEAVSFTYPGRKTASLRDFSVHIEPGEHVGIVGRSGAGKSTLLWLLERFYDPQSGRILLGGVDLRDMPLEVLRGRIAVVSQDPYLFHGSIVDNICMGQSAGAGQVEQAARAANAHDFICQFPDGYQTMIGERGARLSGGQRQRVAIARALLRDCPIIVLDEATSSVDARSEQGIQQALNQLTRGRTTLIMAHRLSSIARADRVLVLRDGRLMESGTHASLLARSGAYADLMADQAREAATAEPLASSSADVAADIAVALAVHDHADHDKAPSRHENILRNDGLGWSASFVRLFRMVEPLRGQLVFTLLSGVLPVVSLLAISVLGASVVNAVHEGSDFRAQLFWLAVLCVAAAIFTWVDLFSIHDLAFRLLARMRVSAFAKLEQIAPAYLVAHRSGDLLSLVTNDIEMIEYFFAHTLGPAFVAVAVPIGVLAILAIADLRLALALLPFLLVAGASPIVGRGRIERIGATARESIGVLNAHVVETLQGMHDIVAFGFGPDRAARFDELNESYRPIRLAFNRELALQRVALDTSIGFGGLAVAGVGIWLVVTGRLAAPMLPVLTLLAMGAFGPVSTLAQTGRRLGDTLGATRRIAALQDEPVPVRDGPGIQRVRQGSAQVSFSSVSFEYEHGIPVLRNVSLELAPGKTTALVGPSGSGKTTLAHLLMRFWDPTSGAIFLNGHDLRDYTLDQLRAHIALVAQETYLFNASVRENLLLARPSASEGDLMEAVSRAGLGELLEMLPEGLDTIVGERGGLLSGGQRQRVAIGRAFLKNAPILILDEATSHLDTQNEALVRVALDDLKSDRTTLVIAHRLSTIREADEIVAIDRGRIVERGSHEALVARSGFYTDLVRAQLSAARA